MNIEDIDTYLRARKQQKINKIITLGSVLLLFIYVIMNLLGISHHYFNVIAAGILVGNFFRSTDFKPFLYKKVAVITRNDLLHIIENCINNNAEAIKYISQKKET